MMDDAMMEHIENCNMADLMMQLDSETTLVHVRDAIQSTENLPTADLNISTSEIKGIEKDVTNYRKKLRCKSNKLSPRKKRKSKILLDLYIKKDTNSLSNPLEERTLGDILRKPENECIDIADGKSTGVSPNTCHDILMDSKINDSQSTEKISSPKVDSAVSIQNSDTTEDGTLIITQQSSKDEGNDSNFKNISKSEQSVNVNKTVMTDKSSMEPRIILNKISNKETALLQTAVITKDQLLQPTDHFAAAEDEKLATPIDTVALELPTELACFDPNHSIEPTYHSDNEENVPKRKKKPFPGGADPVSKQRPNSKSTSLPELSTKGIYKKKKKKTRSINTKEKDASLQKQSTLSLKSNVTQEVPCNSTVISNLDNSSSECSHPLKTNCNGHSENTNIANQNIKNFEGLSCQESVGVPAKNHSSGLKYPVLSTDANLCNNVRCLVSLERLSNDMKLDISHSEHKKAEKSVKFTEHDSPVDQKTTLDLSLLNDNTTIDNSCTKPQDKNGNSLNLPISNETTDAPDAKSYDNVYHIHPVMKNEITEHEAFQLAIENLMTDLEAAPDKCGEDELPKMAGSNSYLEGSEITCPNIQANKLIKEVTELSTSLVTVDSCKPIGLETSDRSEPVESSRSDTSDLSTDCNKTDKNPASRRKAIEKPSGEGELSDKCCGRWFPHYKAYLDHLMSKSAEAINKVHEALLDQLDMTSCTECNKWVKRSVLPSHLRKKHQTKMATTTPPAAKIKSKPTITTPVIQSVCSLKEDSDDECLASLSKSSNSNTSSAILCHLTANKMMTVSSVSDLPFNLKPIVMLEKSLSPYKRKTGYNSVPRIVKVESLSTKKSDHIHIEEPTLSVFSSKKRERLKSRDTGPLSKTKKSSADKDTHSVHVRKTDGQLKQKSNFCYAESIKKKSLPLSEKNRSQTPILGRKCCVSKSVKKKNTNLKRFQLSNGYFLQDSESEDTESATSSSEEDIYEQDNKENNDVPTVELDLFTLPSVDEDSSVYLTDPTNPDFKVFASMDAIFVGDAGLGEPSGQLGYITDQNNVVYINPEHFLFPSVEDSNASLDSVKLSQEDIDMLTKFDSKVISSPVKGKMLLRKHSSPIKSSIAKRILESSPKLKLKMKGVMSPLKIRLDKSSKSPLKLNALRDNALSLNAKDTNLNLKGKNNAITLKPKIDPIKKALGLVSRNTDKMPEEESPRKTKVTIENHTKPYKNESSTDSSFDEFFIDSDNISIVAERDTDENEIIGYPVQDTFIHEVGINLHERITADSKNCDISPIVIKVGKTNANVSRKSDRKFIIIVHNSLTKSLLNEYPNYWGPSEPRKILKGKFNYKNTSETYQSKLPTFASYDNKYQRSCKRGRFSKMTNTRSPKKGDSGIKCHRNVSDIKSTTPENGSLLDTIHIDPNSDVIDLPIDVTENGTVLNPKTANLEADSTDVITSAQISQANTQNLSLEEEMKAKINEFVYIDEKGILRSPSGRDLSKQKTELDEEALLINMIENYAENLDIASSPVQSSPIKTATIPLGSPPKQVTTDAPVRKGKYLDVLKGKSAWDTQLLFSPAKNICHNSSTDTASDSEEVPYPQNPCRKQMKRKQSDADLFNIPLSEIPDLLSPLRSNSYVGNNKFVINSPVSLSPNTLSAVLSPRVQKTPTNSRHLTLERTSHTDKANKSTSSLNSTTKENNKFIKKAKSPKKLFTSPGKSHSSTPKKSHKKQPTPVKALQTTTKYSKPKFKNKIQPILKKTSNGSTPKKPSTPVKALQRTTKYSKPKFKNKIQPIVKKASLLTKETGKKRNRSPKYPAMQSNSYLDSLFKQKEEELYFSGFESDTDHVRKRPKLYTHSKKQSNGIKLKISLKNPKHPVVSLPQDQGSRGSRFSSRDTPKRSYDETIRADFENSLPIDPNYESDSDDNIPLQAIILKKFDKSPTVISPSCVNTDSKDKTNLDNRPIKRNTHDDHSRNRLKIRPIHQLVEESCQHRDNGNFAPPKTTMEIPFQKLDTSSDSFPIKAGPSCAKVKRRHARGRKSRDMRSYFATVKSTSSTEDSNNFFEGFDDPIPPCKIPRLKQEIKLCQRPIAIKPKRFSDIRNYLSEKSANPIQSSVERAAVLQKRYDHVHNLQQSNSLLYVPRNFEGFKCTYPEGAVVLRTLQTYVDVLNMQNMFCSSDYSLPLDATCEWDEETVNHEMGLV